MKWLRLIPHSFSAGAVAAVVTSIGNVLLIRNYLHHLPKQQFGLWSLAIVFYVAVQQIAVSFVPALIKAVAESIHGETASLARSYVLTAFALVVLAGVGGVVLVPLVTTLSNSAFSVPNEYRDTWTALIPLVWTLAFTYLGGEVLLSYITARGHITWTHTLNSLAIVCSVLSSYLLFRAYSSVLLIPIGLLCGRLLLIVMAAVCLRECGFGPAKVAEIKFANLIIILRTGYLYLGGALLSLALFPLSKAILVRSAGLIAVAGFEIAYTFSLQIRNVIDVAMRGVLPEVAAINAATRNDVTAARSALSRLLRRYTALALASSTAICVAGYLLSPLFFAIIGASFGPSLQATLGILLAGACVNAIGIPHFYTLMGLGRGGRILTSYIVLACTNILGLLVFVFLADATAVSAAWAVLLSMITSTVYLMRASSTLTGWAEVSAAPMAGIRAAPLNSD